MLTRLLSKSSRRTWSDFVLAKRVDGRLVEAELEGHSKEQGFSLKTTAEGFKELLT